MSDHDKAILGRAIRSVIGQCRICECGGDSCNVGLGEKCMWMDELKTLCSNPRCLQAAEIRDKRLKREKRQMRFMKGRVA